MPSPLQQGRTSNFPGGFPAGLSVLGMPLVFPNAQGQVFYVNNSTASLSAGQSQGSDGNKGTFNKPLATLQAAINRCISGAGDTIIIGPGHAENIASATALAINKANINIIGMGVGDNRPTFTLTTANTAKIVVSTANVSIVNCVFVANFLNIANLFDLTTAKGFNFDSCEVRDTSAILNFLNVFLLSATSNANDGLRITQNRISLLAASGVCNLVSFRGTINRCDITDNLYAARTTNGGAVLVFATTKFATNLVVARNQFLLVNATGTATGLIATSDTATHVGLVQENFVGTLATTPLLVTAGTGLSFLDNKWQHTADRSGLLSPAVDS
jgi:hypothetical protein